MERNLMVAGFGGQGVMTLGKFLADATCNSTDKNVTFFPSYGAEQRGGTANCYVVIADEEIGAPLGDAMDDLIVMNGPSRPRRYAVHQQLHRQERDHPHRRQGCEGSRHGDGSGNGQRQGPEHHHARRLRRLYAGRPRGRRVEHDRAQARQEAEAAAAEQAGL